MAAALSIRRGTRRDVPVIVWEAVSGKEVRRFNVASSYDLTAANAGGSHHAVRP